MTSAAEVTASSHSVVQARLASSISLTLCSSLSILMVLSSSPIFIGLVVGSIADLHSSWRNHDTIFFRHIRKSAWKPSNLGTCIAGLWPLKYLLPPRWKSYPCEGTPVSSATMLLLSLDVADCCLSWSQIPLIWSLDSCRFSWGSCLISRISRHKSATLSSAPSVFLEAEAIPL